MLGRGKLDNILLTCDQGSLNQITARSGNRTPVTVVRDTCTTNVPPAPHTMDERMDELSVKDIDFNKDVDITTILRFNVLK